MADLHVYKNDCDWYVAESVDDADLAHTEATGFPPLVPFRLLEDDSPLTITCEDDIPAKQTKSCAEWARENGRGFLCSTEI